MQSSEIRLLPDDWRDFDCPRDRFADYLRDRQSGPGATDRIADLWLAFACLQGCDRAVQVLEREHIAKLSPHLAKMGLARDQIAEALQRIRCEVLLPTATQPPLLTRYQGRGTLAAFLRAVATRIAFRLMRDGRRAPAVREADELDALGAAVGGEGSRQAYAEVFSRGLRTALTGLDPRDRTLLRQVFVDRLSIDGVAALHQVHRATAARGIQRAKDALRSATYEQVSAALGVAVGELDSVARWVQSQVELSLHRLQTAVS